MRNNTLVVIALACLTLPPEAFGQAPSLGTAADFALFTSVGAVSNTGASRITGNVGTNTGAITGFGNVNGVMHNNDDMTLQTSADVLAAYNALDGMTPTSTIAPLLGNGQILTPGVYSISAAATLDHDLILDAGGDEEAVFIFQIDGAFSTTAGSRVQLINAAEPCVVFWSVDGLVSMATGTHMKGTIIANNAAINMAVNDTLEGRALSTTGAISLNGAHVHLPIYCGIPLEGPAAPSLGAMSCYSLFSADGPITNSGSSWVKNDIGSDNDVTTGFNPGHVNGVIHSIPDVSTAQCAADLADAYAHLNGLSEDIELLYPDELGNKLVLTPHTYVLNGPTVFTDTLYLDAKGNPKAVFVIKVNGTFSAMAHSCVALRNGARSSNVFWQVEGDLKLSDSCMFRGTAIGNNGTVSQIRAGASVDGRVAIMAGPLETTAISIGMECEAVPVITPLVQSLSFTFFPNPFVKSLTIAAPGTLVGEHRFLLYNKQGKEVMNTVISQPQTTLDTAALPAGVYFYQLTGADGAVSTGKLYSGQ
ncbi:MAG: ice-binding family protein [Flavobacteriales bacterium]